MIRWLCASFLVVVGCASKTPLDESPGNRVTITVSPLSLSAVTDAIYRLRVVNGDAAVVWTAEVSSSRYGDGQGALSYVGPCDASSNDNTIELELLDVRNGPDSIPFVNPTANGPLRRTVRCEPNRDVAITFDLTIMRPANQGFFERSLVGSFTAHDGPLDEYSTAALGVYRLSGRSNRHRRLRDLGRSCLRPQPAR